LTTALGSPEHPPTPLTYDERYITVLRDHIKDTKDHLVGASSDSSALVCSFIPPSAYWTPVEKASFFHALAVHSRFRPDLISACIPGKTLLDVCAYLDVLEEAAQEGRLPRLQRCDMPTALEVSDTWLAAEDEKATAVVAHEPTWIAAGTKRKREAERVDARKAPRSVKADVASREARKADLMKAKAAQTSFWAHEDALSRLELPHLRAMDRILRDAEEAEARAQRTQRTADAEEPVVDNPASSVQATEVNGLVVDPALLQPPSLYSTGPDPAAYNPISSSSNDIATLAGLSTSGSHRVADDLATFAASDPDVDADPDSSAALLALLSPTSRRRHQKRLYMRRRRAAQAGTPKTISAHVGRLKPGRKPKPEGVANASTGANREHRASPSTQAGNSRHADETESDSVSDSDDTSHSDEDSDAESNTPSTGRRKGKKAKKVNQPGLTKEYAIRRSFERAGIDAHTLRTAGLGVFRLGRLGKLMRYDFKLSTSYKNLIMYSCRLFGGLEEAKSAVAPHGTDAQTVALLAAHVSAFVGDVMHHAVSVARTERALKAHTKVWRLAAGERGEVGFIPCLWKWALIGPAGHEGACARGCTYARRA
jgi:hypothetical protein